VILLPFFAWYLAAVAAGIVALPLSFQLFRHLPDRGYTFAKALGLLATGWVFWFLGSLGFLRNDVSGVLFAALVVGAGGLLWLGRPGLATLRGWLSQQRGLVLGTEALFLGSFALMAFVRAHNPDIQGTEKPMEFMFINSILRSPAFPAHDAWLSGHAISYYYFGYVIIAALAHLTTTASSVAFNLGLALLFALTAAGAHGVVLNLIALQKDRIRSLTGAFWPALLGPVFVLVVGNFYGLAQLAYTNGTFSNTNIWAVRYYFGKADPANPASVQQDASLADTAVIQPGIRAGWVDFWAWLDLKQTEPPAPAPKPAFNWDAGGNWFFGARVLHDRDLMGQEVEAIDEMPAFSFLLGDMHPHVLSLPFVVLAVGLALEWLLWGASEWEVEGSSVARSGKGAADNQPLAAALELSPSVLRLSSFVLPFFLTALVLGGLSFLNTWDFPIYLFLTMVAFAAGLGLRWGWKALILAWWRLGVLAVGLAVLSVALYFPFYLTFQSQAGGILPNVIWPTRFQQTIVFFGPPLIGATIYLAWLATRGWRRLDRRAAVVAGGGIVVALVLIVALMLLAASFNADLKSFVQSLINPLSLQDALGLALQRRLVDSAATLFPALLIGLGVGLAVGVLRQVPAPEVEPASQLSQESADADEPRRRAWRREKAQSPGAYFNAGRHDIELAQPAVMMALAMLLTGSLLLLGPEWVYLRDNFGWRMNTLFKFYFQTWTLWSLAAAFGFWHMAQAARRLTRWAATGLVTLAVLGGLVYTGTSLHSKLNDLLGPANLDGMSWYAAQYPDDWAGIQWLQANVTGSPVIAEAVGGAYNIEESRMAMATGLPTVMGWTNHEGQWRGAAYSQVAERPNQIKTLYQVRDWSTAQSVLDRYQIEYVVVGNEERTKYNPLYLPKFDQNMDAVFKSGNLIIYRRKPAAAQ
jgi:YYY domain-containing protein